jgi:hypothetical protein
MQVVEAADNSFTQAKSYIGTSSPAFFQIPFAASILQACFVFAQNGSNGQPSDASNLSGSIKCNTSV